MVIDRMLTSPDWTLLLLLAPGYPGPGAAEQARALAGRDLDWSEVFRLARRHEVCPLVARNLQRLEWPDLPDDIHVRLADVCWRNAIRARLFRRELARLAERFDAAGVPMAPLKGPALAERLYGDVTRRVCVDIDILAPRGATARAVSALRAAGYDPAGALWADASEADLFLASDIETNFRRRGYAAAPLVDLHWDIARRWRTDDEAIVDLWTEAYPVRLWGARTYRLSPEWELLYLVVHAVRHRWQGLKWLVDIHDACAVLGVDWDRLAAKAERFGWGRALRLTLGLCRALLGTEVPETLAARPPRWALAEVQGEPGGWKNALIPVRVLDRRADRLRYLLRLLLQPTILERRAVRLPAALALAYYPLRPLRLAARWTGPIAASALKAWRSA